MKLSFENNNESGKDFSLPLEIVKEKKEKLNELKGRIIERERFIEYLKKNNSVLDEQRIANIKKEIRELKGGGKEIEKEIFDLLYEHKEMSEKLEDFKPDIEQ
jgi:predicted  nucleic acid-binding Zn-ribbon protein